MPIASIELAELLANADTPTHFQLTSDHNGLIFREYRFEKLGGADAGDTLSWMLHCDRRANHFTIASQAVCSGLDTIRLAKLDALLSHVNDQELAFQPLLTTISGLVL